MEYLLHLVVNAACFGCGVATARHYYRRRLARVMGAPRFFEGNRYGMSCLGGPESQLRRQSK